jgi:tetratricopeptide (TPR) repeat protein
VSGEEGWLARLKAYCLFFVGNALRVANDFDGADETIARAWALWNAGADFDPPLLPEWRLFDLEASLRRAQQRFDEALERLDRARAACGDDPQAIARVLLNKEFVCEQKGDLEAGLAALEEATPWVERSGDPRLLFAYRFKIVNDMVYLERYGEAAKRLPGVRELAEEQAELNRIRLTWLEARVATGEGRTLDAIDGLEQVRRYFTAHKLPYDAALSALDLAVLWLQVGRTAEVKELALGMAWIFLSKKIHREALAALTVFCEAAQQEAVTVELTRRVIAEVEKVRRSASPPDNGLGGRG